MLPWNLGAWVWLELGAQQCAGTGLMEAGREAWNGSQVSARWPSPVSAKHLLLPAHPFPGLSVFSPTWSETTAAVFSKCSVMFPSNE